MRIAHITATFPPYFGGTGSVCFHNAAGLARLGHDVHIYTSLLTAETYAYPPELKVHHLLPIFRIGNAPFIPGLLKIKDFDILHLHFPFYTGAELISSVSKLRKIPFVVTYHQDVQLGGMKGLISRVHDSTLGAWSLKQAKRVFFTTLDYGQNSKANWLLEESPQKVIPLPNGIDIQRFNPHLDSKTIRDQYGIDPKKCVLLMVAGLDQAHYFKGVEVLLKSISLLNNMNVHLIIVGDGDLRGKYQKKAIALNIHNQVTFAGRVSDEQLPLYYAASDIGVLPSITMGEAFGVVLLESMACGKPVVASNLPGVRAVFSDEEEGFLAAAADPNDLKEKLSLLIENPNLRKSMGTKGRHLVEQKYDWSSIVKTLEKLYLDVLEENS